MAGRAGTGTDAVRRKRHGMRIAKTAAGTTIVAVAIAYIGSTLSGSWTDIRSATAALGWREIVLSTVTLIPMYIAQAAYHVLSLESLSTAERPTAGRLAAMTIYMQAQIVRYLPGKIWGVVYQAHAMNASHPPTRVVAANLFQNFTTLWMAVGISISIIGAHLGGPAWLLGIPATVAALEALHRSRLPGHLIGMAARVPGLRNLSADIGWVPTSRRGLLTSLLSMEWGFFALGMGILFGAILSAREAIVATAWYAGASIISLAAVMVPAGIAVREALFIGGNELFTAGAAQLTALAVAARCILLTAEIGTAVLLNAIRWAQRHE